MSELKEIELGEAYKVFDDDKEFYLKSEADEVIAEKDKTIAELKDKLQAMLEERDSQIGNLDAIAKRNHRAAQTLRKKMNHHKFKRCLAMVKYCHESAMWLEECGVTKSATFMLRWYKRWLELAEKFKEAK